MNKYEILYIINNQATDERKQAIIERIKGIITKSGGNIIDEDIWGTRKFAYPIKDQKEGYYVLMNFEAKQEIPAEINRQIRNMEDAYRCMILKK